VVHKPCGLILGLASQQTLLRIFSFVHGLKLVAVTVVVVSI
jgi:hypothetical protein